MKSKTKIVSILLATFAFSLLFIRNENVPLAITILPLGGFAMFRVMNSNSRESNPSE
jgi:hypothetical protein